MDTTSLFIPADHVATRTRRAVLWKSPRVIQPEPCEPFLDSSIIELENQLDFKLGCRLHVVVYSTNREARAHLDREIPSNMLLAPVLGACDSVIAVQSAAEDKANGDCKRMQRHLFHELAHVMVALRTGSEKRLGDGDSAMKVPSWLNEGFAVCAAAIASGQLATIERAQARANDCAALVSNLDHILNDLNAEHRSAAFAIATVRVWDAIQAYGLRRVFNELPSFEGLGRS